MRAAPESAEAVLLPAEFLTAQNRRAEAEKILEAARKRKPERIEFWLGQVEVILQERAWDRAAALLQETQNRFGDKVPIRLARARMVVRQHGPQGAAALRSLAAGGERFSDAERLALWRGLADAARQIDDFAAAQTFAQRAAEKDPDDLAVRMLLFELALRNGNDSDMERILGEIGSIEGQGPYWHYGHALRSAFLAEKRKDDRDELLAEAEKHAAAARALRPAWSRLAALTADLSLAREPGIGSGELSPCRGSGGPQPRPVATDDRAALPAGKGEGGGRNPPPDGKAGHVVVRTESPGRATRAAFGGF